jgi:multidrug efflux pump subunit AcrA (membrane-fusion protein)
MFWRKPVTHAAALWVLVGAAAGGLIAVMAYASAISHLRKGVVEARPSKSDVTIPQQQPPSLFGTVDSFDGTVLKVDSKQPYDEVIIESDTTISTVGGSAVPTSELKAGAVVTATGKDLGDRRLSAYAIVILESR